MVSGLHTPIVLLQMLLTGALCPTRLVSARITGGALTQVPVDCKEGGDLSTLAFSGLPLFISRDGAPWANFPGPPLPHHLFAIPPP